MRTRFLTTTVRLAALLGAALFVGTLAISRVHADEKPEATAIPTTSAAIWQSVDQHVAELSRTIESGQLSEVHHQAFAIRDLVNALPAHSAGLPPEKMLKVNASGKFVAILAARLDAAGDANDKTATVSNFKKLQEVLKSLRATYAAAK